jgi:Holliday junction resolvase
MTEQQLQKKIINLIEQHYKGYAIVTIKTSKNGCPDILACINGKFFGIEVKLPGKMNTVTPIQHHNIKKINESGGCAIAVEDIFSLQVFIDAHLGKSNDNDL